VNTRKSIAATVHQFGGNWGDITCREMIVKKISFGLVVPCQGTFIDILL